jgi:hypothetical protein
MNDTFLKYIKNEKDISRYKVSLLKKGPQRAYKSRLLSIERDFLEYPFEKISFDTIESLKKALSLFKTDRHQFEKLYSKRAVVKTRAVSNDHIEALKDKFLFYEKLYEKLLDFKIKEINLLEDPMIRSKVKRPVIHSSGIDDLLATEGAHLAKKRARIQILLYCFARFVFTKAKDIKSKIDFADVDFEGYDKTRRELDALLLECKDEIYNYYNDGIKEVPLLINGTLGHNNFVHSIYPLVNLFDNNFINPHIKRLLPEDKAFFSKNASFIKKRFVERGYGLVTPMVRKGNESICLLYLDLWTNNGISIRSIMEKDFFNYSFDNEYYKAIATKPICNFNDCIDNSFLLREVLKLLSLDKKSLVDKIDFNNPEVLRVINNVTTGTIELCPKSSKALIPATRSEAEHIREAYEWLNLLIKDIKNDYKDLFDPITFKDNERELRISKVKEIKEL